MRFRSVGIILLGVLLVLCIPILKAWTTHTKTAEATLLLEGRALIEDDVVRLSFPGSQVKLATHSSEMSLNFDETQDHQDSAIDFQINGGAWQSHFIGGRSRLELSADTESEGLEVNLIRRSEAWQGDIIFSRAEA